MYTARLLTINEVDLVASLFEHDSSIVKNLDSTEADISNLEMSATVYFLSEDVAREWKYNPYVVEHLHTPQEAYCAKHRIEILPSVNNGKVNYISSVPL